MPEMLHRTPRPSPPRLGSTGRVPPKTALQQDVRRRRRERNRQFLEPFERAVRPPHPPRPELLGGALEAARAVHVLERELPGFLARHVPEVVGVGRPEDEAPDARGEVAAVEEGVGEAGEAEVRVVVVGEGVEEVEEDRLGDGAQVSAGRAEAGEGGLIVVDGACGFNVGDLADAEEAAVKAEVLADFDEDFDGEGEEGGSGDGASGRGGLETEVCHCVFHGGRQKKTVVTSLREQQQLNCVVKLMILLICCY